ncbi:MAG: hypothetical protein IT340_10545 [Chloroflexi bacterium]|nr:hypothetical protein [Chloroflexota bacterium]
MTREAGRATMPSSEVSPARIAASEVGDYLYCARALALRRLVDGAADPLAAICRAQGLPRSDPAAAAWLAERTAARQAALAGGARAHARGHARARLAVALLLLGLVLLLTAGALAVAPMLALPR